MTDPTTDQDSTARADGVATTTTTTDGAPTMTAIVQDRFGSDPARVLRLGRVPRPELTPDRVIVRVRAAAVDRGTVHLLSGHPYLVRVAGYGIRRPKSPVPGLDLAGTVEEVGAEVTGFAPGDEVYGTCEGSFAEFARTKADRLSPKPANLSFEQAAAVPVSGLTALQGLRDKARVEEGDRVLITGASGRRGVLRRADRQGPRRRGDRGVQCRRRSTSSTSLGADHVIDYTREDVTAGDDRFDVILDIGGNTRVSRLRRILTPKGRLVIVGGENGGRWTGGVQRQVGAVLLSPFVSQTLTMFVSSENAADLAALTELVEAGAVTPAVEHVYPLAEAPVAVAPRGRGSDAGQGRALDLRADGAASHLDAAAIASAPGSVVGLGEARSHGPSRSPGPPRPSAGDRAVRSDGTG